MLSSANEPIKNYALNDTIPITKGAVEIPVTWKNARTFELPAGRHARLQFQLKSAKLYAFWIK